MRGINGIYLITLARRHDRLEAFLAQQVLTRSQFHLMQAFDGNDLVWNEALAKLFGKNKFLSRRGVMGCALSHLALWRHIATTTDEYHLILEDDVVLNPTLIDTWNELYYYALPSDAEMVYLGDILPVNVQAYNETMGPVNKLFGWHRPSTRFVHNYDAEMDGNRTATDPTTMFHYQATSYILSSRGARLLVDIVARHGYQQPSDMMMMRLHDRGRTFATIPYLVTHRNSPAEGTVSPDPDIQSSYVHVKGAPRHLTYDGLQDRIAAEERERHPVAVNTLVDPGVTLTWALTSWDQTLLFQAFQKTAAAQGIMFTETTTMNKDSVFNFPVAGLKTQKLIAPEFPETAGSSASRAFGHLVLWEKMAALQYTTGLVLEARALLPDHALARIRQLLQTITSDWDVLSLSCIPCDADTAPVAKDVVRLTNITVRDCRGRTHARRVAW